MSRKKSASLQTESNHDAHENRGYARLIEVQHRIRNKVGIIKGTFELLHPEEEACTQQEIEDIRRIQRALNDLIDILDDLSENC